MLPLPSLVVLGPQTPLPSQDYLSQIRQWLIGNPRLATFRTAVQRLPELWELLVKANPNLLRVPGISLLEVLSNWIDTDELPISETVPETISTPLTVIVHIVEYARYLDSFESSSSHSLFLENSKYGGFQGFCTGFLSAIALSCSRDIEQISALAAVSLRLAACIGACVDLDGRYARPPRDFACLSIRWADPTTLGVVQRLLDAYSEVRMKHLSLLFPLIFA